MAHESHAATWLEQTLLSASDSAAEPSEAFLADDFFFFRFFFTLFFSPCADQQERAWALTNPEERHNLSQGLSHGDTPPYW